MVAIFLFLAFTPYTFTLYASTPYTLHPKSVKKHSFYSFPLLSPIFFRIFAPQRSVNPEYKECIQRMQYYPSGLPWAEAMVPAEQPFSQKYVFYLHTSKKSSTFALSLKRVGTNKTKPASLTCVRDRRESTLQR